MSNENVHPIFKGVLNSISGVTPWSDKELYEETEQVMLSNPSLSRQQAEGYAKNNIERREHGKTIPTTEGDKTIPEILDHLMWCSYKANRGYGCSHEGLVKIGIGNEAMRLRYEAENPKINQNDNS